MEGLKVKWGCEELLFYSSPVDHLLFELSLLLLSFLGHSGSWWNGYTSLCWHGAKALTSGGTFQHLFSMWLTDDLSEEQQINTMTKRQDRGTRFISTPSTNASSLRLDTSQQRRRFDLRQMSWHFERSLSSHCFKEQRGTGGVAANGV